MGKLIIIPNSKQMIYDLINDVDGYIIGISDLSVNLPITFELNETIEIIKYLNENNKDIFISLNKNMHNNDIELLKQVLLELDKYKITGIMYYDISILNLKNDLVWSQEHLTTNICSTNFWYSKNVKYTYLSSEITRREIEEIKNETKSKLLVNLFGYIPIFTSRRHLVTNYLNTFNLDNSSKLFYMTKEGNTYPLVDNKEGTVTYSAHLLNGIKDYDINVDYIVLNSFLVENFEKIINIFKEVNENNKEEMNNKINELINNTSNGFLHKETIYKVK